MTPTRRYSMSDQSPPSKGTTKLMDCLHKGSTITVWREVLAAGETLTWHYHTNVTDTFYVVKGPLRVSSRNPDKCIDIPEGELYQIATGIEHQVNNATSDDVEWILIQGIGEIGRASCRERVCRYVWNSVV